MANLPSGYKELEYIESTGTHIELEVVGGGGYLSIQEQPPYYIGQTIHIIPQPFTMHKLTSLKANGIDINKTYTIEDEEVLIQATFQKADYEFITDRTQQDVDYIKELNNKMLLGTATEEEEIDWNIIKKGALNRGDLERLFGAINILADWIELTPRTQEIPEFPKIEWYDNFVLDIKDIVRAYYPGTLIPRPPYNTYQKWNKIEEALKSVYDIIAKMMFYYCGNDELYCADDIVI